MGKKQSVMVDSGSSALLIAMRLLDLPRGSVVITPALTFSTDIAAIYQAGYKLAVFEDLAYGFIPNEAGGVASLANCDQIMEHGIKLPCQPTMTKEDCAAVEQVLEALIEADGEH